VHVHLLTTRTHPTLLRPPSPACTLWPTRRTPDGRPFRVPKYGERLVSLSRPKPGRPRKRRR